MGLLKGTRSNRKTTIAGLLTAFIAIANAGISLVNGTQPDWTVTIGAITAAIGLIFARDGDR